MSDAAGADPMWPDRGGSDPKGGSDAGGGSGAERGSGVGGRFDAGALSEGGSPNGAGERAAERAGWIRGEGPEADVVVSSRVRLARNVAGFSFVPRLGREDRSELLEHCRRRVVEGVLPGRTSWVGLHEASGLDRQLLAERHLISKQHASGKLSTGQGGVKEPRGVAVSLPDERMSVMVNEEDHIRIQVMRAGLDVASAYEEADAIDDNIERTIDYAFSPRFGYLCACPTNVGTGARFSVMVHLPGLRMIGEIDRVKRAADDMSLAVRGFYGEGSETVGDFYQISNQTTLGRSERVLLDQMEREIVPRVVEYERHARSVLMQRRRAGAEDEVQRALGLLRHARLLETDEAVGQLSRVRLGVLLGLIEGVDLPTVNGLLLRVHPAHLQQEVGRGLSQQERRSSRAELVRRALGADGG